MLDYKQMAAVLATKLTTEEFARLVELLDSDANGDLLEETNAIEYTRHPETYGPLCACRHPEGEHSAVPGETFCYCQPCGCPKFTPRSDVVP